MDSNSKPPRGFAAFWLIACGIICLFNLGWWEWSGTDYGTVNLVAAAVSFICGAVPAIGWSRARARRRQIAALIAALRDGTARSTPSVTVWPHNPPSDATRRRWAELDRHTPSWKNQP